MCFYRLRTTCTNRCGTSISFSAAVASESQTEAPNS